MSIGNTAQRIIVSVIAIPIILAACYAGYYYFFLLALGIGIISFYEFYLLAKNKGAEINLWFGQLSVILLAVNGYQQLFDTYYFLIFLIVALLLLELFRNKGSAISNVGVTLLGIFYIGLFTSALIGIREFYPKLGDLYLRGGYLIISILAAIWVCDSAAFFGGINLGRHKLFPRVSPNKSWEGAVFGFTFAVITMIAAKLILLDFLSWNSAIVIGVIIGIIGQLGDLVESLIKRDAGVKDSSNLIPGHGGIFDRFDSLLFTAPVILFYLRYFEK